MRTILPRLLPVLLILTVVIGMWSRFDLVGIPRPSFGVATILWSPSGETIAVAEINRWLGTDRVYLRVYNAKTRKEIYSTDFGDTPTCGCYTPDGNCVCFIDIQGNAIAIDIKRRSHYSMDVDLNSPEGSLWSICMGADKNTFCCVKGKSLLVLAKSADNTAKVTHRLGGVMSCIYDRTIDKYVVLTQAGTIATLNLDKGTLYNDSGAIANAGWFAGSSNGMLLVPSGRTRGDCTIIDLVSGLRRHVVFSHDPVDLRPDCFQCDSNGSRLLFSSSFDSWAIARVQEEPKIVAQGKDDMLCCACIDPKGENVAIGSGRLPLRDSGLDLGFDGSRERIRLINIGTSEVICVGADFELLCNRIALATTLLSGALLIAITFRRNK